MTGQFGGIREELSRPAGSPLQAYRSLVLGGDTLPALLRYELITCLLGPIGGTVGVYLRRLFYPFLLREAGSNITFGRDVVLRHPGSITIGADAVLGDHVALDVRGSDAGIAIGRGVKIGRGTLFACRRSRMTIGPHVVIGRECRIGSTKGIEIGAGTVLGDAVCLSGAAHSIDRLDVPIIMQSITCKGPTRIGERVTIGEGATVLDGVTVGSGAGIAPGSLVNKDLPEGAVVSGVPAVEGPDPPSPGGR